MRRKDQQRKVQQGASLVEIAFALPFFLFLTVALIDVSRYFFYSLTVDRAAWNAVDILSKSIVEADISTAGCTQSLAKCQAFCRGLVRASETAEKILLAGGIRNGSAQSPIMFRHYSNNSSLYNDYPEATVAPMPAGGFCKNSKGTSIGFVNFKSVIGMLRPGERIRQDLALTSFYNHPLRLPKNSATDLYKGWPVEEEGETWDSVLYQYPLAVHIEVTFTPFLSIFGIKTITHTELATRRTMKDGLFLGPPSDSNEVFQQGNGGSGGQGSSGGAAG